MVKSTTIRSEHKGSVAEAVLTGQLHMREGDFLATNHDTYLNIRHALDHDTVVTKFLLLKVV